MENKKLSPVECVKKRIQDMADLGYSRVSLDGRIRIAGTRSLRFTEEDVVLFKKFYPEVNHRTCFVE